MLQIFHMFLVSLLWARLSSKTNTLVTINPHYCWFLTTNSAKQKSAFVQRGSFPRLNASPELTRLPRPASDRLAPGPRPNTVDGLDPDLVHCPLFQVLDGELSLQTVDDDVDQRPAL